MDRDPPLASTGTPWARLLRRTVLLLAIWFLAGPVLGILLVEPLNSISVGGIPLGFWMSQQGSIYIFVLLIFAYAWMGDRVDRETAGPGTAAGEPDGSPSGPGYAPASGREG